MRTPTRRNSRPAGPEPPTFRLRCRGRRCCRRRRSIVFVFVLVVLFRLRGGGDNLLLWGLLSGRRRGDGFGRGRGHRGGLLVEGFVAVVVALGLLAVHGVDEAAREGCLVVEGVVGAEEIVPETAVAVVEQLRVQPIDRS